MTTSPAGPVAGRREWIGLAVIALPCLVYSMDLTVLNLALPALSASLRPSSSQLLWIVDIYGFMVAGALIPMGALGDRIGRRRLLLIGAAAFGVCSVLAAFARSPEMLIALRALLGLAGATLAPSTLSLIRNMFLDDRERTLAIGIWVSSYSAGAAVGPLVGGALLEYFWWGSVFLVAVPVMLLLLAIGPLLLPEFRDPAAGRTDVASSGVSLAAVLATVYGLKHLAEHGAGLVPAVAIAAGIALGVWFVRRQRRLADPLIDLRLFRVPAFSASLVTYTLGCLAMFGVSVFIAQYLQLVLGLSALHAGLWTVPWAAAFLVGSMATPPVARRFGPGTVVTAGLALAALGFALLTQTGALGARGLLGVVAATVVMSLGLAPVVTLATDLIIGAAPPERAGAAAAISETSAELGGAVGIALFGSIGTAVYRALVGASPLEGVPPQALDAARSTLGAALSTAAQLPPVQAGALADVSRAAFTRAMEATAVVAAVLMVAAALLAAFTLRRPRDGAPLVAAKDAAGP